MPIGKIDIMRKFSFFEVQSNFKNDILNGLRNVKWNNIIVSAEISQAPGSKSNASRKSIEKKDINNFKRKNKRSKKSENKNSSFKQKFKAANKRKR